MKRTAVTLMLAGALVLSLGILGFAQMGMMNKPADSSQTGQKPADLSESQMVDRMASNQEMITNHFDSLQTLWNKMMVMNNVSDLKAGWQTYKNEMKVVHQEMVQQGMMYKEAMPTKEKMGNMSQDQQQMLQKMDNNYQMMSSRFDSLQTMTDKMMQMNDMSELKTAMKDYQHSMMNMHEEMAKQGTMYKRMMAMMGETGGMNHQKMMQNDSTK